MTMERVVSKNLFNFKLKGELDDDIQQADAAMAKMGDPIKLMANLAKLPLAEFSKSIRGLCDAFLGMSAKHPRYLTGVYSCNHSELKVDTTMMETMLSLFLSILQNC
eukprot:TRINITY_DN5255_c0_g1_i1.p1 TRINITY_DN5255_c0_g1~~TRINITY_DN5255_c0_g1_i1.p1  ORF type:complete len:107 (-),score=28.25 TRINITY_DN5255_c0_g1_i1:81-401(-)